MLILRRSRLLLLASLTDFPRLSGPNNLGAHQLRRPDADGLHGVLSGISYSNPKIIQRRSPMGGSHDIIFVSIYFGWEVSAASGVHNGPEKFPLPNTGYWTTDKDC